MAFPRVDVYNAFSGSTMLVQYIGSAQDLVALSANVAPLGVLFLADATLLQLRSQGLAGIRDLIFSTGVVQGVAVQGKTQVLANSNGIANWIIWGGGFSAGSTILVNVEIIT
jgi:hypothetical protein